MLILSFSLSLSVFMLCRCLCTRPLHYSIICIWATVCMPMDKNKVYFSQFVWVSVSVFVCTPFFFCSYFFRCFFTLEQKRGMFFSFSVKKINFIRLTFIKSGRDRFRCRPLNVYVHKSFNEYKKKQSTNFWVKKYKHAQKGSNRSRSTTPT